MKIRILLFLISLCVFASGASVWAAQSAPPTEIVSALKLDLTLSKTAFEVGEAIPYVLTVENASSKEVEFYDITKWAFGQVSATNAAGQPVWPRRFHFSSSGEPPIIKLAPGGTATLTEFVNRGTTLDGLGEYHARAGISTFANKPAEVSQGFSSNQVTFDIIPAVAANRDARFAEAAGLLEKAATKDEKLSAILQLGYTFDERAIPLMVSATRDQQSGFEVQNALGGFRPAAVRSELIRELDAHGPNGYLNQLLPSFETPSDEVTPIFGRWLRTGTAIQRASALRGLSQLPRADLSEMEAEIVKALGDPNPGVRIGAIEALSAHPHGDILVDIARMARTDPDPETRREATSCLGRFKNDQAVAQLKEIVYGHDEALAQTAVVTLAFMRESAKAREVVKEGASSNKLSEKVRALCQRQVENLK